jgi:glycosyltransferase involved in cell wall biosynthesis
MKKVRVVMVTGASLPTLDAVVHYTSNLLHEMRRLRPQWEWIWLCRRAHWYHCPIVSRDGVRLVRPNHTWSSRDKRFAAAATRYLRPDIVHIQEQIHSFHETNAAVAIANATPARVVTTMHEFHIELPSVRYTIDTVNCSDYLIANDTRTWERCLEQAGRTPDVRGWSPANIEPVERVAEAASSSSLITTFGVMNRIKSFEPVLQALIDLRTLRSDLQWQLVGPIQHDLERYYRQVLAESWINFTGRVGRDAVRTALSNTRVMVLPYNDGASTRRTSLQTSWAFGLPIVTTWPDADEPAIVDGYNCLLVRSGESEEWKDAIGRVLDDPGLAQRLREGARATARKFSWDNLARLNLDAYDCVLRRDFSRDPRSVTAAVHQ